MDVTTSTVVGLALLVAHWALELAPLRDEVAGAGRLAVVGVETLWFLLAHRGVVVRRRNTGPSAPRDR